KQKPSNSKFTIKIENDVKLEPSDDAYLVQYSPPQSPIEASGTIKSESESDEELHLKSDPDYVKTEIKTEVDECSKKNCDAPEIENSNDKASDDHDGTNGANSRPNPSGNIEQHAHKTKATKKRGTKKNDNAKIQIDPIEKKIRRNTNAICAVILHRINLCSLGIYLIPFVCEICAKAFTQKSGLNRHKKVHATEFPFHCPKCRRGFKQEVEKIEHENQCQYRQYECIECKYITDNSLHFKQHMPIHSDVRPFQCRICSKTFI
ncbi:zinc finger protein 69-like, partial [Contarinia nasturtii]|uniref:zinc finger protein 69-like n=1 Tax=Contarinia nasturtii TaxID=265458 RepID=UPI0012D38D98